MIVIKSGRHPLAVTLLVFCAVSGVSNLLAYSKSATNVLRALPPAFGLVFYGLLALGSAVALVGVFWPGLTGPHLERSGLLMLTGVFSAYAVLVIPLGLRALFFSLLLFGFALGNFLRVLQIGRDLKRIRAAAAYTGSTEQLKDG